MQAEPAVAPPHRPPRHPPPTCWKSFGRFSWRSAMAAIPSAKVRISSADRSSALSWPPQDEHSPVGPTVVGPTCQPLRSAPAAGDAKRARTRASVPGCSAVSSEPTRRSTEAARSQEPPAAAACSSRANSASVRSSCCSAMAASTAAGQVGGGGNR